MKQFLVLASLLAIFMIIFACRKNEPAMETDALIIGLDSRKCICCGGWWLEIQGDTLRALDLPADFAAQIDQNTFPMPVKIRWERDNLTSCFQGELILVKSIRKP